MKLTVPGLTGGTFIKSIFGNSGDVMSREGAIVQDLDSSFGLSRESEIEVFVGDVSLCLLLNRPARCMRILDFRTGIQEGKLDLILEVAKREGMERAFTITERGEADTWAKLGFEREGILPGYYKRSDGYLLAMETQGVGQRGSRVRIRVDAADSFRVHDRTERAYQAGEALVESRSFRTRSKVKVVRPRFREREKALAHAQATGRVITHFENFSRDSERSEYLCTSRGGFSVLVGVEEQPCFGHAFLDVLCAPRGEKEARLMAMALDRICADLAEHGQRAVFAISPARSPELTAAWLGAGFCRTGRLLSHLWVHGERVDAFLWSRRMGDLDIRKA